MNGSSAPLMSDDFKRISGIGPAIERRLHQAGILTFAQLAALTPEEIADLVRNLAGLSAERIAEQDWPGQAQELAAEATQPETLPAEASPGNRQHDISFTVKLLLNDDKSVRRTQVVDNRSKAEEQWAGWNASRIVVFMSQQAALRLPSVTEAIEPAQVLIPPVAPMTKPLPSVTADTSPAGTLHLRELEVIPADIPSPGRVLRQGIPFSVRLTLDLTEAELPGDVPLNYTATAYAKSLRGGPRLTIGEVHNTIRPKEQLILFVPSKPLAQGTYRLEAVVILAHPSAERAAEPGLRAHLEGGILQIV